MSDTEEIPKEMKRLVVKSPGDGKSIAGCTLEIETVPTPIPGKGEVLIKVSAAPVNPSDYGGWYGSQSSAYPMPIGLEGCGVVVSTGFGASLRCPVGTKVGFIAKDPKQGSYSEYVTMNVMSSTFPMPDDVPIEDCASFFVNPYTAVGILETAKQNGSNAFVHTAAASQLGQMMNKLAIKEDMEIINIVRREEQKELLEKVGAKHIIVTGGVEVETWKAELKEKIKELGATCAFDAVAGDMSGHLLDALPKKGLLYIYGRLGGNASGINPVNLIYREKQLKGFYLTSWLMSGNPVTIGMRLLSAGKTVNSGLGEGGWCSSQFEDITMDNVHTEVTKGLEGSMTGRKLRVRFA